MSGTLNNNVSSASNIPLWWPRYTNKMATRSWFFKIWRQDLTCCNRCKFLGWVLGAYIYMIIHNYLNYLKLICKAQTAIMRRNVWSDLASANIVKLHHTLAHGAEPFFRRRQLCTYSWTSQHCMEPEGSIPCPQKPSTGPYSEPENPIHTIPSP
jgi:hypothetical protein